MSQNQHSKITNKMFEIDDIMYCIDENNKTCSVFRNKSEKSEIIIPSSIKYKAHEYYVTSIKEDAFFYCLNIKSLKFASDSKLKKIGQNAFFHSKIESILFPKSLIELEEGWCNNTSKLTEIIIDHNNHNFIFYDNKYIIGKTNQENENYDHLLFSR